MSQCENYTYSQAQEVESLVDTSLDTQLSQQLKSNPIAKQSSDSGKQTGYYLPSLFLETSESSAEPSGEERLISLQGDSLVRTFQRLVEVLGLQENGRAFGEKWRELSVRYNPNTHSWKTHQCSLLEGLDEFSETWPKWGMMQGGVCWERIIAVHPTEETESGSWPTPAARDWKGANSLHHVTVQGGGRKHMDQLPNAVKYATPRACSAMAATITENTKNAKFPNLETQIAQDDHTHGGQLNPPWVEWLMGWPVGWTDLKPLETDKFQSWQQQHGGF